MLFMLKVNEFVSQVLKETKKVSWASKRETLLSLGTVIFMVVIASFFFLGVDVIMYKLVNLVLNLGVS